MSDKKSYVCNVMVFKDGIEKHPEDVDKAKQYLKDQLSQKAIDEMDAGEYVISLHDVRRFDDDPAPFDDMVTFKQKLIVQPLVRCKDCKHREIYETCDNKTYKECELDTGDPWELGRKAYDDNWFCADGERREDE